MSRHLKLIDEIERVITILLVLLCLGVLIGAFVLQLYNKELPCPLCILQRIGFIGVVFGLLLNLKYGFRPIHYSIILLSGLFTSFVALRQIVLHIIPGTGAWGGAVFGLHLYTWSFIISIAIVIAASCTLSIERENKRYRPNANLRLIINLLFALAAIVTALNVVSTVLECGFTTCPDSPMTYRYL